MRSRRDRSGRGTGRRRRAAASPSPRRRRPPPASSSSVGLLVAYCGCSCSCSAAGMAASAPTRGPRSQLYPRRRRRHRSPSYQGDQPIPGWPSRALLVKASSAATSRSSATCPELLPRAPSARPSPSPTPPRADALERIADPSRSIAVTHAVLQNAGQTTPVHAPRSPVPTPVLLADVSHRPASSSPASMSATPRIGQPGAPSEP
jgi:hypothetical protein